jgi:hypothetical protein
MAVSFVRAINSSADRDSPSVTWPELFQPSVALDRWSAYDRAGLLPASQKPVEIDALVMQDGTDLSELKAKTFQPNNLVQTKQLIRAVNPPAYSRSLCLHQSMTLKDAERLNGETEEAGCFCSSSKRRTRCHGLLSTDTSFMGAALRSGSSVDWAKKGPAK